MTHPEVSMRRSVTQKLLAVLLASTPILFVSCDLPLDFWDEKAFTVNIPVNSSTTFPATNGDVDLSKDPEIASHLGNVKTITIPEIWIQVVNIYDDNKATKVSGTMTISDASDASWTPIVITYQDIPIAAGGEKDITPTADDVTRLQALIQAKKKFHVVYAGSIDQAPSHFDVKGRIHVTANVGM